MIEFAAGIIDSRGHIEVVGRHGVGSPRIRVTTKRIDLLRWLADRTGVGVKVDERGYQRRGCSEHCTDRHQHIDRQSAYWNIDGQRATVVLFNVLPYLVDQISNAHTALSFGAGAWPAAGRTEITAQLARHGWDIPCCSDLPSKERDLP